MSEGFQTSAAIFKNRIHYGFEIQENFDVFGLFCQDI